MEHSSTPNIKGGLGSGTSTGNMSTGNINTSSSYRNLAGIFVSGNSPHKTTTSHLGHEMVMSPMAAAAAAAVVHANSGSYYANTQQISNQNLSGIGTRTGVEEFNNRRRALSIMDLSRLPNLDSYSNDSMGCSGGGEGDVEMGMVAVGQTLDGGIGDGDDIGAGDDEHFRFDVSPPRTKDNLIHSRQPFEQINPNLSPLPPPPR